MLELLNLDRATRATERNRQDPIAANLAATLCRLFGIEGPIEYSTDLVQFVAEFQRSRGLLADGIIGDNTLRHLKPFLADDLPTCDALWNIASSVAAREHFASICNAAGFAVGGGRPTLLALRGVWLRGRTIHPVWHAPLYDDAFVLLTDSDEPFLFRGATHPYQLDSQSSADLDRDGRKDVGMVRPGNYVLEMAGTEPPIFRVLTASGKGEIPVYRDTDHDARISAEEKRKSETATSGDQVQSGIGAYGTEILLHPGYDTLQSGKTAPYSSIGCQTAPVDALRRVLAAGRSLDYVLVDAIEVLPKLGAPVNVG
jgi:hypothetical protein